MSVFASIAVREVRRSWTSGGVWLPIAFFLLVATLFPFAIGPDPAVLARVGGGVIWSAALLAALLPVERLVAPDLDNGVVDQLAVREVPLALVAAAKVAGHWLAFAPPLLLAAAVAAGLLGIESAQLIRLELGLLIGTPGLAALGVGTAALTAGLRGGGGIAGLVLLPFAAPLLIFGSGAMEGGVAAMKLLGAVSLTIVAGAPFVAGAAMRMARE